LPGSFGKSKLSRKIRKQFTSPFPDKRSRYGTLGFAKSLLNDQHFFESQLQRASLLTKKPLLLIWGMEDKFAGKTYLERFQKSFPESKTISFKHTGHFPQEENSAEVIDAIQKFIQTSTTS
jgi:pimeloyl-ACP methyl ester carboxylesterase